MNLTNMVSAPVKLSVSGYLLGWYAVITGILTAVAPLMAHRFFGVSLTQFQYFYVLALGVSTAIAGFSCLRSSAAAFRVLFFLFLVQTVEYFSNNMTLSLIGPFALKIGWGSFNPLSHFNINIIAFVGCFFSLANARRIQFEGNRDSVETKHAGHP